MITKVNVSIILGTTNLIEGFKEQTLCYQMEQDSI